ncbi:MAG: hypothetical protein HY235_23700 [Acidobacteria bacterium]|nr:hypothetical protein [Acidobacteriota bacterium]
MDFVLQAQARHEQEMLEIREQIRKVDTHLGRAAENIESLAGLVLKLAERQDRLDRTMETLAEAQIASQQRSKETDERIDRLVVAIGEMARRQN